MTRRLGENRRRAIELLGRLPHGWIDQRGDAVIAGVAKLRSRHRTGQHALELGVNVAAGGNRHALLRSKGPEVRNRHWGEGWIGSERVDAGDGGGVRRDVAADPLQHEIVLADAGAPERQRIILAEPNVRIDSAAAVHGAALIGLAAWPSDGVAFGAREPVVFVSANRMILALDDASAGRAHVADDQLDDRAVGHRKSRHEE